MNQWSVEPVFGWLAVVPLALVMIASLWLTMTVEGVTTVRRLWLLLLRLLAVAVMLLGWLRPGLVTSLERDSDAAIAVLIDSSQSMTMPSGYEEKTRWQTAREVWQTIEKESATGFGKTRFIPFTFDIGLHAAPPGADQSAAMNSLWSKPPTGKLTDLGSALAELQRTQVDPPLRGVIMITDAVQTVLPPPADPILVTRQLEQLDQPLVVVGVGPRSEKSQLRDLAIDGVSEHITAFEKNKVSIPAVVHARGMQNSPIKITMTLKSAGKPDIALKSYDILASGADQTLPMNLDAEAPESGEYLLEIKGSVDGKELVTSNNTAFAFMTVRAGGSRILYIEGQPRSEQTYLKRSLNSLDFQVDYRWLQEIDRSRWPYDLTKVFNLQQYDAFILGDIDAKAFAPVTLNAIRQRVDRGAGILFLGGWHSYDAGGYGGSILADLFPVTLAKNKSQSFDAGIDQSFHITGPVKFMPVREHPITRLANEPENEQLWKSLKPLLGANRLGKPKLSPGVQVLAQSPNGQPLLVTGEYGRGRVLAFAGDSTYQWWLQGMQLRHKQFWRQSILWLLGRDSLQEGFRLSLDRRRLLRGEEESVAVEWVGGSDNKPMPTPISLELVREGKLVGNLDSQPAGENRRTVRLKDLNEPGLYRLVLKANAGADKSYTADVAFVVRDESREMNIPSADWQMMQNMAAASARAGGRLIPPDQLREVLDWLRDRQAQTRVTTLEKRRLGDGLWDSWLFFAIFCGVLTFEWALRKKWQLP